MDMSAQIREFRRLYHLVIKDAGVIRKNWSEKDLAFACQIDKKTLQRMRKNGRATQKTIDLVRVALDEVFGDGGKRSKELFDALPEPATDGATLSLSSLR